MRKLLSALIGLLIASSSIAGTAPGISDYTNNSLAPIAKLQLATPDYQVGSGLLILEGGERHHRVNGTIGLNLSPRSHVDLTAEYLVQDIDYTFFSGVTREWMHQSAAGIGYHYALDELLKNIFDITGYVSHVPGKHLSPVASGFITHPGGPSVNMLTSFTDLRYIAGSNAEGVSPGVTLHPWEGAETTLAVNYDNVVYHTIYQPTVRASGFGGTASIKQDLHGNFNVSGLAGWRAPFNNYRAGVNWIRPLDAGNSGVLTIGVFGEFVYGKKQLPNTSSAGVNVNFDMGSVATSRSTSTLPTRFATKPAVLMPQVLAIADELVGTGGSCLLPSVSFISDQGFGSQPPNPPQAFNAGAFFTGATSFSATGLFPADTIDPATGIITFTGNGHRDVTVTGSNSCGSLDSNTFGVDVG